MIETCYRPPGHGDSDIAYIGDINFDTELISEAEVESDKRFNTNGIGEMKVLVYGPNEGNIPHFHLESKNGEFKTCICIYSANFFSHGGTYRDTLNNKQCRQLNKWLSEPSRVKMVPMTNWQAIVVTWENNNIDCKFPESRKVNNQPHYENMSQFKDS